MKELMGVKLREELLATYPHELHHNVASRFWGTGQNYDGQNVTGKILMEIRKDLRTQRTETSDAYTTAVTVHPEQPSTQNVLMVADSQLRGFQPDRIKGVRFTLEEAKSMEEVSQELLNKTNLPPTIVLHLLTESLMKDSVSKVTSDIRALTKNISQRHGTRVLVSLGLPVDDYNLNKKIRAANVLLKSDDNLETICHTASLTSEGYPIYEMYRDWMHVNREGMRRLAQNLKSAILKWKPPTYPFPHLAHVQFWFSSWNVNGIVYGIVDIVNIVNGIVHGIIDIVKLRFLQCMKLMDLQHQIYIRWSCNLTKVNTRNWKI